MQFIHIAARARLMLAPITVLIASTAASAGAQTISFDQPDLDRWMYPFNISSPGARVVMSTFGATGESDFDDRDGQILLAWNTEGAIPPQLGAASYQVSSAVLVLEVAEDVAFEYDHTQDPYNGFLAESDPDYVADADPGQPIELFGTGFRNGFVGATFQESTPYSPFGPFGEGVRSAFALGFDTSDQPIDVSNSVAQRFDPEPFAIGTIAAIAPGELVPAGSLMSFDLDVADANVQSYLGEALDTGRLFLAVTALTKVVQQGGSFPTVYAKENPLVLSGGASAAQLVLDVVVGTPCPEDIDDSGAVGFSDLTQLLIAWGVCPLRPEGGQGQPPCAADLDDSGAVGFSDLTQLLVAWGPC